MLTAPPVDEERDEDDGGGRERRKLSLPGTEVEEPPPFHVDSKEEEAGLCTRRLEEGSDRRPAER